MGHYNALGMFNPAGGECFDVNGGFAPPGNAEMIVDANPWMSGNGGREIYTVPVATRRTPIRNLGNHNQTYVRTTNESGNYAGSYQAPATEYKGPIGRALDFISNHKLLVYGPIVWIALSVPTHFLTTTKEFRKAQRVVANASGKEKDVISTAIKIGVFEVISLPTSVGLWAYDGLASSSTGQASQHDRATNTNRHEKLIKTKSHTVSTPEHYSTLKFAYSITLPSGDSCTIGANTPLTIIGEKLPPKDTAKSYLNLRVMNDAGACPIGTTFDAPAMIVTRPAGDRGLGFNTSQHKAG